MISGFELLSNTLSFLNLPSEAMAAPLVVPALRKHTATVIWAHGLGDTGAGWMPIAENFRRRGKFSEVAFVFPNAPEMPITVNFGMCMPGWYDIVRQRVRLLDGGRSLERTPVADGSL